MTINKVNKRDNSRKFIFFPFLSCERSRYLFPCLKIRSSRRYRHEGRRGFPRRRFPPPPFFLPPSLPPFPSLFFLFILCPILLCLNEFFIFIISFLQPNLFFFLRLAQPFFKESGKSRGNGKILLPTERSGFPNERPTPEIRPQGCHGD